MKAFNCLFWATLYCVLYLVRATEDDLLDFDFAEAKDVEWNYENDAKLVNAQAEAAADAAAKKKIETNMLDFAVEMDDDDAQNHLPPFDWREKVLRNALAKALTDKALRQKFAEVMPILRLLSSQQRLALSALISAQMNAKKGHELKLNQVRMMFQDDKKLLLPIVYDLANLVKNSARKFIHFGNDLHNAELRQSANERNFDLTSTEEAAEDADVGTIRITADSAEPDELEDFFDKMPGDLLDPQSINEELQAVKDEEAHRAQLNNSTTPTTTTTAATLRHRARRAANEFVHKLIRSMPASVNEEELMRGAAGRTIKLNTTAFEQRKEYAEATLPSATSSVATTQATSSSSSSKLESSAEPASTQSYAEIEDIAFADLNGTEFQLNPNERLDKVNGDEFLPNPEELIAGPRYRLAGGNKLHSNNLRNKSPIKRKRVQVRGRPKGSAPQLPPLSAASSNSLNATPPKKCERFTATMCLYTDDYPLDQIMGSIRRHKNAMSALLAEFYDKPNHNLEFGEEFDDYVVNKKRREDEGTVGGMCQSVVRYARPQKARSASGEWKYIVNTGQHTQTLRLEKCSNAGESCSYLAQTYRSHCSQVYNYHRLLSWDKLRGLHVDIFKVPTCCSCQVDGYRQQFPPLSSLQSKDFTPSNYHVENGNAYSTINEDDLDYNDESDEDELSYVPAPYNSNSIGHQHKQSGQFDGNELFLSSKKVRTKVHAPPTVGSYLSPPDDEYRDADYGHKSASRGSHSTAASAISPSSSHKKHYSQVARRRPHNEPRVDLDLSPSETYADKEVNIFGTPLAASNDKSRVSQKRKRIYSAPHTVSAGGAAPSSAPQQHQQHQQQPTIATSTAANSAANAHQVHYQQQPQQQSNFGGAATATATATSASASSHGHVNRNYVGSYGSRSRPRFYAPGSAAAHPSTIGNIVGSSGGTSSAATTPTTESTYQRNGAQSTTLPAAPSIYHVNSIFSSSGGGYNATHAHSPAAKRINYSYHPIIDFFDKNKRGDFAASDESTEAVEQPSPAHIFPHKIASSSVSSSSSSSSSAAGGVGVGLYQTSHERRIGFGAGAGGAGVRGGVGVGVGGFSHAQPFADDNAWRPVVAAP